MTRRTLTGLALILAVSASTPTLAATEAQWRRDIDQVVENIRRWHPDPFARRGSLTFARDVEALKTELPRLSEEQRTVRVMQLSASLEDRTTFIELANPAFADWYPVRIFEFADGYFITAAHKSVADLAGAQVLEVGGRPAAEAAAAARSLASSSNAHGARERLYAIHNAGMMQGLGLAAADRTLRIRVKLASGRVVERTLTPRRADSPLMRKDDSSFAFADLTEVYGTPVGTLEDWVSAYRGLPSIAFRTADPARPLHLSQRRVFYARALPERGAFYVQLNYVSNSRDETFEAFVDRIMREVDKARPRRLILDLRYNGGGDGSKALSTIHQFIKREDARPWKELYILVSGRTAGAAVGVVDAFKDHVPVTLVGEPTGTGLNEGSDARSFAFADTGLRQTVTWRTVQMGQSDDLSRTLPVDVPAAFTFADWAAGRDPALDPILDGAEMRSIGVIALASGGPAAGGAAARRAHAGRQGLRGRHPWWEKPRFEDVKAVGYDLLRDKRPADSMEIFALLTELYPDNWNSWESLGRAQIAAGLKAEARMSYRCAMRLDAETFDAGDLRAALAEAPTESAAVPAGCPAP